MRNIDKVLCISALLLVALDVRAAPTQDSYFTYDGIFTNGGTVNGSLMINTTTGALDSGSVLIANMPDALSSFDGTYLPGGDPHFSDGGVLELVKPGTTDALRTLLDSGSLFPFPISATPGTALIGWQGQALSPCVPCGFATELSSNTDGIVATIASGQIVDPPASAPEIDPAGAAGALTMLCMALAIARSVRFRY